MIFWKCLAIFGLLLCFITTSTYSLDAIAASETTQKPYSLREDKMDNLSTTQRSVMVCIDDEHLSQIQQISQELQKVGMSVDRVLTITGVITGSVRSSDFSKLNEVVGVQSVELQQSYQLPPPNAGPQ